MPLRRALILAVTAIALVAACTPTSPGAPQPDPDRAGIPESTALPPATGSLAPGATPSISVPPGTQVIGTCPILPDTDCHEADLTLANLEGSDLRRANLRDANLYGADLRHADLRDADLTSADLRNTDLTDADLRNAILTDALFKDSNLTRADLEGAEASNAQFTKSLYCETIRPDGVKDDRNCADVQGTTTQPTEVAITKFKVPKQADGCVNTVKKVEISLEYETVKTKTVTFEVDGEALPDDETFAPGKGKAVLEFVCARAEHDYTIIATDVAGNQAKKTKSVKRG